MRDYCKHCGLSTADCVRFGQCPKAAQNESLRARRNHRVLRSGAKGKQVQLDLFSLAKPGAREWDQ